MAISEGSASTKRGQRGDGHPDAVAFAPHSTPSQRRPSHTPHTPTMSSELDGLCCPLTLEVFEDPCTLVGDGHTYERASIQAWLDSGKLTSPTTGAAVGSRRHALGTQLRGQKNHPRRAGCPRAAAAEGDVAAAARRARRRGHGRHRGPLRRGAATSHPRTTRASRPSSRSSPQGFYDGRSCEPGPPGLLRGRQFREAKGGLLRGQQGFRSQ